MKQDLLHLDINKINNYHAHIRLNRLGLDFSTERTVISPISTLKELKLGRILFVDKYVGEFLNSGIFEIGDYVENSELWRFFVSKEDDIMGTYYPVSITPVFKEEVLRFRKKWGKKERNVRISYAILIIKIYIFILSRHLFFSFVFKFLFLLFIFDA